MNIYVETNFVLELALLQEQAESCSEILGHCEQGRGRLIVPAWSLAEASSTLNQRGVNRQRMKQSLDQELQLLARSSSYSQRLQGFRNLTTLLVESTEAETHQLSEMTARILGVAEVIALNGETLKSANGLQEAFGLRPPDAFVLASVLAHLGDEPTHSSYFVSRDSDFDNPGIVEQLTLRRCKLLGRFDHALAVIRGK